MFFFKKSRFKKGLKKYRETSDFSVQLPTDETALKKKEDAPFRVAVLNFKGDLRASGRHELSQLIDEVLLNKEVFSEVVLKIESPGGSVSDYGHAYSEIVRLRESGLKLTVCVDTVAASGGYLMALPATQILAAPFAMVGSIGVVSFVPNFRKLLERFSIEPRTFTAGDYKRTVTLTDDATPEQIDRYKKQLELIHTQFKQALSQYRAQCDLSKVATGEAWMANTSVEMNLNLVDHIQVSSDYLLKLNQSQALVLVSMAKEKRGLKTILKFFQGMEERVIDRVFEWMSRA